METIELREYIKPLLRWWWLLALSTLVAVASSAFFFSTQPEQYQSRATIMVGGSFSDPNPDSYGLYTATQLISTYSDLINRDSIRQPAMEALGLTWLPQYTARAVPNTQLMELSVTDTDAVRAQAVAAELVRQLILASPAGAGEQQRQDFISGELNELQAGIEATKEEIARKRDELVGLFSARQIADTENQIQALENKVTTMQANFTSLLATTQKGAINAITVIEEPRPGTPVDSKFWLNLLFAAAIGFILAAGGAYLIEYLDDTFKNSDDIQKRLGLATVGAIPELDSKEGDGPIMMSRSLSPQAESYRVLRTNLQFAAVAHTLDTVLITSPVPGEGKSTTATNLAVALAQSGRKVVLIDADLHRPKQHRLWQLPNSIGLTSALLGDSEQLDLFLQPTQLPTLRVLTSGPLPPNAAELLGSHAMHDLLQRLISETDTVVIDSPPVTAVADAAVMSSYSDGVLLVVYAGKTRRETVKRAQSALEQVGAHVVGVVLNRMPVRGSGYYYYYQHSKYGQYYRRDDDVSGASANTALPKPFSKPIRTKVHANGSQLQIDTPEKARGESIKG